MVSAVRRARPFEVEIQFAADSLLEESGLELSVPRQISQRFRGLADIREDRTRLSSQKSRLLHVMSNKRIKLRFRVTVALVIVGGYQPTVRSHLPRCVAISRPPRILCVSPTFIRI